LQEFPGVLSSAQTATFKRDERLSLSSRVITNLPIFTLPGDTTGDTNLHFIAPQFYTWLALLVMLAIAAGLIGYYLVYAIGVRIRITRHERERAK